jgi:hypothetical protein
MKLAGEPMHGCAFIFERLAAVFADELETVRRARFP